MSLTQSVEWSRNMPLSETDINLDQAKLPDTLRDLIEVIGLSATTVLLGHYGGSRLYIPKHPAADNPLIELLGLETVTKLTARYQLCVLEIPKLDAIHRFERDMTIRRRLANGESPRKLSTEYGLTIRHLRRIT
jgi:hypothetical protein